MHSGRKNSDGRISGARKNKKIKNDINCDGREWADLPDDLFEFISNKITSIEDYFKFGRVCRSWRQCYLESKQRYIESHSPLAIYIPTGAYDQSSYFYDITAGIRYKARIPYFAANECLGVSSGYLIIKKVDISSFWVMNPFSGHKLQFPLTPLTDPEDFGYDAVFASIGSLDNLDFILIVLSVRKLMLCKLSDNQWKECYIIGKPFVEDLVVFNGKIFVITTTKNSHHIGILNLRSSNLELLNLKCTPRLSRYVKLVASKEHLFMVDTSPKFGRYRVYRIDFLRMEWVTVKNLGDQALFIGNHGCSRLLDNPAKWGGRSNCVYHLLFRFNKCYVYSLNDETLENLTLSEEFSSTPIQYRTCWYFPDQLNRIDNIRDD